MKGTRAVATTPAVRAGLHLRVKAIGEPETRRPLVEVAAVLVKTAMMVTSMAVSVAVSVGPEARTNFGRVKAHKGPMDSTVAKVVAAAAAAERSDLRGAVVVAAAKAGSLALAAPAVHAAANRLGCT